MDQFSRTELLLGEDAMRRLAGSHVAVFGIGGVGGYVVEALARSGVGRLTIVDDDDVSLTNLNRQVIALHSTIGRPKVEVMAERLSDIDPSIEVDARKCFYLPENSGEFDFSGYSYVVDAVDTVTAKLTLVAAARAAGTPVISAMGAGNKLDPTRFEVADIYETSVCPLARVMRKELRRMGVESLKVVYSKEPPVKISVQDAAAYAARCETEGGDAQEPGRRSIPGSTAFAPAAMGLAIAAEVVRDLIGRV